MNVREIRPKIVVVMFGHQAQVGKDTCCSILMKHNYRRYAFADKIKDIVSDLYGFSNEQMHGANKDLIDERYVNYLDETTSESNPFLTPRRVLQEFGNSQRRIYSSIWSDYVFSQIDKDAYANSTVGNPNRFYCISDFRFKNEYNTALNWRQNEITFDKYLMTIKIDRPNNPAIISGSNDISENELSGFPNWWDTIINDGSLQDLEKKMIKELDMISHCSYK